MNSIPTCLITGTALGLFGLGPFALSLPTAAAGDSTADALRTILDSRPASGGGKSVVVDIVDLGPEAIPAVLELLSGQGATESFDQRLPGLGRGEEALLMQALIEWPEERLGSAILERLDDDTTLDTRLWSMRILGDVGGVRSLPTMLEIIENVEPIHFRRKFVSGQIENALREVLERDVAAYLTLEIDSGHLSPELQQCVARTLGRTGGSRAVELMVGMLGRDSEVDMELLSELANLRGGAVHPDALSKLATVRQYIRDPDIKKRELAILALGRLHDVSAIGEMIGILSEGDPILSKCALTSLRRMSGVQWSADAEVWQTWFEREKTWLAEEAPALAEKVKDENVAAAAAACRELSAHPLFRRPVTEALRRGLRHPDPAVVVACCAGLERASGVGATTDLIDLLSPGRSEPVRLKAHETLVAITGQRFPPRRNIWKAWNER